jgi:hypothetical protein
MFAASIIRVMSTSDTSVNASQTTRRNNPEDSHLPTRRRENLKSESQIWYRTLEMENKREYEEGEKE